MKFLFILCYSFVFAFTSQGQVVGLFRVCPDQDYSYEYLTSRPYFTINYTVVDGFGVVSPYNSVANIKFPSSMNVGKKPRVVATIRWTSGEIGTDTSQAITVLAIGDPAESVSMTRSFPCSFRGTTTVTIGSVVNANSFDVTNDAGWPVTRTSNNQFVIDINNGAEGKVSLIARQDSCNKTRVSTIQISRPKPQLGALTSTGSICEGGTSTFNVPAYPNATSYTWTANNANIRINGQAAPVTISGTSGNSVQITSVGGSYSDIIRVVATSECGNSDTVRRPLTVGIPPIIGVQGFEINGMHFAAGQVYPFSIILAAGTGDVLETKWTIGGGAIINSNANKTDIDVRMNKPRFQPLPGAVNMVIEYRNQCGWSNYFKRSGDLDINGLPFTVSPNPASNYLNIQLTDAGATASKTATVNTDGVAILYDMNYREVKRMKLLAGTQQIRMDLQNVWEGTYILQIIIGKEKSTKTVVISHPM
ncbi:MAG: T9SS type A sorting domain-containing protein [Chitinophaga sp.]|uniref:T9SS type A sorting domain-containing protein n=1 Tax=Chitinophaga sp. TaxID=1869181 RepID=UPI001B22268A|nr:T9SS type A sorting domain-containing protein [Chitinophaga sp.]MBO9727447.1 T9SS type A sorting domain-containing protein [Chitinophaga sp.]